MSLQVPTARRGRAALERPFDQDHEASVERKARKGIQPKGLAQLVAWFRECCDTEIPVTLHKSGVWYDHGEKASGGSALGAPAYSDPFRRFIENSDSELDQDGYYTKPLRAALSRFGRRHPLTARHLYRLALVDGDWRRHAEGVGWQYEEMEIYLEAALRMLWLEYAEMSLRLS